MADKRNEFGTITAEYAVGTLAACGFASLMYLLHDYYDNLLRTILGLALQQVKFLWPHLW